MLVTIFIGATIMMSGTTTEARAESKRMFLMLNDQSIEFSGGVPVLGYWRVGHRWEAKEQLSIDIVDGVEFVIDKQFWKMVKENGAINSAKAQVRVEGDGRLFYRDRL